MRIYHYIFLVISFFFYSVSCGGMSKETHVVLTDLRCENLINPIGIDNVMPHFSWKIEYGERIKAQKYYEIQVASDSLSLTQGIADLWDSGRIKSASSVMIPYAGNKLKSRSLNYWRVRVGSTNGKRSGWSPIARFGVSILDAGEQQGDYIGLSPEAGKICAPLLKKTFVIHKKKTTTLLYVNSLGYHEVYFNGNKVGDHVLSPAVSQLNKRSLIVAYDVTDYLREGENELLLWLGQGWYKTTTFGASYGGPLVKAELVALKDNREWDLLVKTDSSWLGRESGYSDTGDWWTCYGGEKLDGRLLLRNLKPEVMKKIKWYPTVAINLPGHAVSAQMCEPNKIQETIVPVDIKKSDENTWLVDMGKVFTGWFEIHFPDLPEGHEITIEYSDDLNKEGRLAEQGQSDIYIAAGNKDDMFCNKFHNHAFRYVKILNLPVAPEKKSIKGYLIHTDYRQAATFECSDTDLNAIHDMVRYTMKCLTYSGYMVDCPHLERTGYGGDGNSSTMSLQTMYDVSPVFANWMLAWKDAMREGGSLPHVAPNPKGGGGGPYWCGFVIQAPWRTYLNYRDSRLIEKYYPMMKEWLEYVDKYSPNGLLMPWPETEYRGWYLGDWLPPKGVDATDRLSVDLVSNCFISDCLGVMSKIASFLNKYEEAQMFASRKKQLNELIHQTFYNSPAGIYSTGSQIDMVYPILVGATPDSLQNRVEEKMIDMTTQRYNGHIACGLVGVPILTEWAIRNRKVDFIYQLLKKRDYPGYLYMIDNKATTTWEYWSGERSRVHNCYNGIGTWFYQAIGGLRMDEAAPGYNHVDIDPQIPDGVTWAKVTKESPYGEIGVNWKLEKNVLYLWVQIPVGVTATVHMPEGTVLCKKNGKEISVGKGSVIVNSGTYEFVFT